MEIRAAEIVRVLFAIRLQPWKPHIQHRVRQQRIQMRRPVIHPVNPIPVLACGLPHGRIDNLGHQTLVQCIAISKGGIIIRRQQVHHQRAFADLLFHFHLNRFNARLRLWHHRNTPIANGQSVDTRQ